MLDENQITHKMKLASDFEMQGKFLHAVQIYNSIILEKPDFTDAYFALGEVYEKIGNIEPAIGMIRNFLTNNPENKEVRIYLSEFLMRNERWEDANEILSYVLPEEEPVISFFLGYSHFMQKDYEVARINFLNFLNHSEPDEMLQEANLYLAKIDINLKDFKSALEFLKKTEVVYSNFWEWNLLISVTYYNLGMYTHAVVPVQRSLKLNPHEKSIKKWAGKIFLRTGDYQKAEKQFLEYIDSDQSAEADIYAELAEACFKSKKPADALAYFEIALKLDPENKFAMEGKKKADTFINKTAPHD
ncbi:MAG TPA: tetratricopeptide repeat protein [Ignavibacteriaceae bacterium]|nr:tetratricopeptide repeat protein [Ignavibacteriaceae bacterium]